MKRRNVVQLLLASVLLCGCKPDGPASTRAKSSAVQTFADRIEFLNRYVQFRRTYESLDFDVVYQNNNGGAIAGPSDWDVRLVAVVPAEEIAAWIPSGIKMSNSAPTIDWIMSVPTSVDVTGINEWYVTGQKVVGIDRKQRVIAYRMCSTPF